MQPHSDSYISESTYEVTTSATTLVLDLSLYKNFFITLGDDLDTLTLNNIQKSWTYHFVFIQGATLYTVTLPSAMVTKGDIESAINKINTETSVTFKAITTSKLIQSSAAASVSVRDQKETWTATEGQTDFVVSDAVDNEIYDEYLVIAGGQIQYNIEGGNQAYSIVDGTNVRDTLRLSEGVTAGTEVVLQYRKEEQVTVLTGDIASKAKDWTWSEGTSGGGDTYMDFVIDTAAANSEIFNISSCLVFVDKVLQVGNYSVQTTNYTNDTLRIVAASGDKASSAVVALFYSRSGISISGQADEVSYDSSAETGGNLDADKVNLQDAVKEVRDWGNSSIQKLTTFTDTNIIVDGTKSYSTVKAITAATHTITASDVDGNVGTALSAEHRENNVLSTRYSFSQDCTLSLVGFDTVGNKTGSISPIQSGTYDFYFIAGQFGVWLGVKNNEGTSSTAPTLSSITIENASPTNVVMAFNEVATGTNLGFTLAGTTSATFASISGSGTNTLTGVLATQAEYGETITLSYNSSVGDIQGTLAALDTITNQSVTNNISAPVDSTERIYTIAAGTYNTGTTLATNGQTVETWADQSGNGQDATESTDKPIFRTDNGNELDFDTSKQMVIPLSQQNPKQMTIIARVRVDDYLKSAGNVDYIYFHKNASTSELVQLVVRNTTPRGVGLNLRDDIGGTLDLFLNTGFTSNTQFITVIAEFDTINDLHKVYVDTITAPATSTYNFGAGNFNALSDKMGAKFYEGAIKYFRVTNNILNDSQKQAIFTELSTL